MPINNACVIPQVLDPDQALMRSLWQRPNIYVATFDVFALQVQTDIKDATKEKTQPPEKWDPVINIGPNRLGFVGEPMIFDANDSYQYTFSGGKQRNIHEHTQGYGTGNDLGLLSWNIARLGVGTVTPWQRLGMPWTTPVTWTPPDPGLFLMRVAQGNTDKVIARRYMRVYADRQTLDWKVTALDGLTGGWGEGWTCTLTMQTENLELASSGIVDNQAIGIYCEDMWWNGVVWVTQNMGNSRQEPRVVMCGYVKEDSIQKKNDAKTVTFTLESVTGQMDRSEGHKVAIWRGSGPNDSTSDVNVDPSVIQACHQDPHKQRCLRRAKNNADKNNSVDSWGAILKGFGRVCVSDFALWYLQTKTNLLEWHDYYAIWNDNMADLESIAGEETSVLSNLQTVGGNDWIVVGAMADNAIYFAPDRQVMRDDTWNFLWQARMNLGDADLWEIGLTYKREKPIKYVKLTATKTADFQSDAKRRRKQRKQEKANQIEGTYPSKDPPKFEPGGWYVRSDLLHDNDRIIQDRAQAVYAHLNIRWSGVITTGLNRALHPGYTINLSPTANTNLWGGGAKSFLITNYSAQIDVANRAWTTIIEIEELV